MATLVRYFKAEDGSTCTVVMVAAKKSDITATPDGQKPQVVLYASLLPQGVPEAAPVEFIDQELFTLYDDAAEGWLKYAFAWPLKKAKSYELRVAVSDGPAGKIATRTETLALPDFKSEALMLSSVTLARSVRPLDPGAPAENDDKDRYRVGSLRLIPWVKPVLTPKDDLAFFYDVYNARKNPVNNKPLLDVTYVLESKNPGTRRGGKLEDRGKQEERLGYTIGADTLSLWPAGEYKLTVQVKDKVAGSQASASLDFTIAK